MATSSIRLPGFSSRNPTDSRPTTSKNIRGSKTLGLGGLNLCSLVQKTGNKSLQSSFVNPNRPNRTKMCQRLLVCFSEPGPPDSNPLKGLPIGLLISVVIPIFRHKFGSFLQIRSAIDKVEEIVHGVEKVAEVVEKVAEEIGENLPAGKLKDAVVMIEHVAEKADKYAQALGEFIDKVEEVGDKLEDGVESLVEVVHRQEDEDDTVKVEKPPKDESL
nr:uncharacterized protein LOC109149305 [Ipomoea batatas]